MRRRAGLLLLLPALSAPARADGGRLDLDYFKGWVSDAGAYAAAPARWSGREWLEAGGVAAAAGGVYAFDRTLRRFVREGRGATADAAADDARRLGDGLYVIPALAAVYGWGAVRDDERARRFSLYGIESLAVSGLFVNVLKELAGRRRPFTGASYDDWGGPSLGGGNGRLSFPSGHSAAAFSWAATAAAVYRDRAWVAPAVYALASATALSRIYQDQHWPSDTVVGAALGWAAARLVLGRHPEGGRLSWSAGPQGVAAVWRFG